ncbi:hypothetical protein EV385_5262 [Krasilnikovia cinnamomea]|uniref:GDSL-like lipase/acylhydrolase family protein n=1 Tax=Krasilnikovia cinnamomea TaxID=349313 RepID=A0A4Q7ZRB7_9ACTN|nr:hypothetical protein [Krasilnikovia cinnamomea]RZU53341.1 hypothetical protein EV385_5262 [Krasilnikovia cinnamomea]
MGDSHAGPIGRAATAAGLPFVGGPMGAGREFTASFFAVTDGALTFHAEEAQRLYRGFLEELGVADLTDLTVPLVLTFGFSAHFYATTENWRIYRDPAGGYLPGFTTSRLFDAIVQAMAADALAFYRHAVDAGLRVLAVLPPQRVPVHSDATIFKAAEDCLCRALAPAGVELVDLRGRVTDEHGMQRPELCEPDDPIHGNLAFGRLILAELLDRGL